MNQTTGSTSKSQGGKSDYNQGRSSSLDSGSVIPSGLRDRFDGAVQGFSGQIDRMTTFIKGKPMVTFAAALGVGFLVGTLILRNKHSVGADAGSDI